ncbi:hypothetical protein [Streptomyces paromomycinus]|uniref:Uncharacterized protein n=1 Tax=Streptomyces paromomycinus TaxID=92743 RepID=A0A401VV27_STREY|nr:hypothetical protein [Streptomyces paromomycinus]GCD40888.1 hypothetical protein GKJPGBOP_00541 [Streptomyces paromomycinus]
MRAEFATLAAGSDRPAGNWVGVTTGAGALLDGADSWARGCVDVLGPAVLGRLADRTLSIESCLSDALTELRRTGRGPHDVTAAGPPGPAAAVVRVVDDAVEWLVVRDAVVILELPGGLDILTRRAEADGEPTTGGPGSGRVELSSVRQAALLSSGAARLVTLGIAVWEQVLDTLAKDGPQVLVDEVRAFEATDPRCRRWPRPRVSDDATAVHVRF